MAFRPSVEVMTSVHTLMPVRAATTGNLSSLSYPGGTYQIDNVTINPGDRLLVKNQTTSIDNGIYVFTTSGTWPRAYDLDLEAIVTNGLMVVCRDGATSGDKLFTIRFPSQAAAFGVVGTDAMSFTVH